MNLSKLAQTMRYTAIPKITKYAKQFDNVEFYTMGEPDFPSPESVKQRVIRAIQDNETYYPETQGNSQLRESIANKYYQLYDTPLTKHNVMITSGATGALYLTLLALVSPGDEVILLSPHYANYIGQIESVGAIAKLVSLNPHNYFAINLDDIEKAITPKTKLLLFNFPNNPLGTMIDEKTMLAIGQLSHKHHLFILSDEVYRTLSFEQEHVSFMHPQQANLANTFIIDGVSKAYSMTGYRLGYVVSKNETALKAMAEFDDWIYGGVPNFIQLGAINALENEEQYSQLIKTTYQQRRDQILQGISQIKGLNPIYSPATFYVFVDIRQSGLTSEEFVHKLIKQEQIVVVPGSNYGELGEGFIRISFATTEERIRYLIDGLARFMEKL